MENGKEKYIFTCSAKSRKLALYELEKYDDSFRFVRWLDDEIGLFETALGNEELSCRVREKPVIFVRHLFKVDGISSLRDCADEIIAECSKGMEAGAAFTVQTRYVKEGGCSEGDDCLYAAEGVDSVAEQRVERNGLCTNRVDSEKDIIPDGAGWHGHDDEGGDCLRTDDMTERVADRLTAEGYRLDVADGEHIISLLIEEETVYWGIGNTRYNLSHWKGGMPHYSPTAEFGFVSRAEYKLLEALECFGIDLRGMERAADLGAAPGGWTKALTEKGLKCTSIDPGCLKPEIAKNEKVRYCHMTVEEYLRSEGGEQFELVVNDMKMDMAKSVNIVNAFYERLRDGGIVIMTFKLPRAYSYADIIRTIRQFNGFTLIGARQLFHNRYEITAAVRKEGLRRENTGRAGREAQRKPQPGNKKLMSKKLERKMQRKRQNKGGRAAADKSGAVN